MDNNQRPLTGTSVTQTPENGNNFAIIGQDFITCLLPVDKLGAGTGTHPGKSFVNGAKLAFDITHRAYTAASVPVGSLVELADHLDLEAYIGRRILVRGKAARDGVISRICTPGTDRFGREKKVGLLDDSHHWVMLDVEHVPNKWNLDPRCQHKAIARTARFLMPPAISQVGCYAQMSSSSGMRETAPGSKAYQAVPEGEVPAELNLHLWIWLDTPLNSADTKTLLSRISAYAVDKLHEAHGVHPAGDKTWIVDSKVAEAHMPHYVAAPKFVGHADPLPEEARGFLLQGAPARGGMTNTVCLAELLEQLPAAGAAPQSLVKATKAPKVTAKKTTAKVAAPRTTIQPRVLPMLPEARAALDVLRADFPRAARGDASYTDWCQNRLFPARALFESLTLIQDRWQTSDEENGWKNGLPVGARNDFFHALCSLILELCPLNLTPQQVRSRFRLVAQACGADMAWFEGEWNGVYDRAAIERYVEHSAAGGRSTREYKGQPVPALYRYRKRSLVPKFCVTEEEAVRLQLRSIVSAEMADLVYRRVAGVQSRKDYLEGFKTVAEEQDAAVAYFLRRGYSQRAIAEDMGISRGSVLKSIARLKAAPTKNRKLVKRRLTTKAVVKVTAKTKPVVAVPAPVPVPVVVPIRATNPTPALSRMVRPAPAPFIASVQGITGATLVRRSSLAPRPGSPDEFDDAMSALEQRWIAEKAAKADPTRKAA